MNPKISGQSRKSNYHNTGSCARAVRYDEHDLREFLAEAVGLGAKAEQMQFFDMDGHVVTADEVIDKIDRHRSGLHKGDAKFYCIMIDPSDSEIAAMGASLTERLANGQKYVYDVMDAYARNFHREGIKDRHNLTAYAIPHLYKGKEKKKQIHWHIIVARKDASNKYKLSPLTNHRGSTTGAVRGGFDREAFDFECERLFDVRFGYERKVEESFEYCLAQKKGTPEKKAEQTRRRVKQDWPDLEAGVKAFIDYRIASLAEEAAARAAIEEQRAKEEAARLEAARIERVNLNSYRNAYNTYYKPIIEQTGQVCREALSMYREAKDSYAITNRLISDKYNRLRSLYSQMDAYEDAVRGASTAQDLSVAAAVLVGFLNPVAGLIIGLVVGIIAESNRSASAEAKRDLRAQARQIRSEIENLKQKQANLRREKYDSLRVYFESKDAMAELLTELDNLRDELLKPVEVKKPEVKPAPVAPSPPVTDKPVDGSPKTDTIANNYTPTPQMMESYRAMPWETIGKIAESVHADGIPTDVDRMVSAARGNRFVLTALSAAASTGKPDVMVRTLSAFFGKEAAQDPAVVQYRGHLYEADARTVAKLRELPWGELSCVMGVNRDLEMFISEQQWYGRGVLEAFAFGGYCSRPIPCLFVYGHEAQQEVQLVQYRFWHPKPNEQGVVHWQFERSVVIPANKVGYVGVNTGKANFVLPTNFTREKLKEGVSLTFHGHTLSKPVMEELAVTGRLSHPIDPKTGLMYTNYDYPDRTDSRDGQKGTMHEVRIAMNGDLMLDGVKVMDAAKVDTLQIIQLASADQNRILTQSVKTVKAYRDQIPAYLDRKGQVYEYTPIDKLSLSYGSDINMNIGGSLVHAHYDIEHGQVVSGPSVEQLMTEAINRRQEEARKRNVSLSIDKLESRSQHM